jgi:hypothetical protein
MGEDWFRIFGVRLMSVFGKISGHKNKIYNWFGKLYFTKKTQRVVEVVVKIDSRCTQKYRHLPSGARLRSSDLPHSWGKLF